jgi:hypothetical protein
MGTRVMANIFIAEIDTRIQSCAIDENLNHIYFHKRYIDHILVIWKGTEEHLKTFLTKINLLHHSIKFTCD